MRKVKCLIVGAGPAGMTAAIYLKRAGIDFILMDKSAPGGELLKTSVIENYPGVSEVNGPDLAMKMVNQLKGLDIKPEFAEVLDITKNGNLFTVKTLKDEILCDNVILATGRVPNSLKIDGEDRFIGKGISYCAPCDGSFYKDKVVAIVGGGNTAITDAIYMASLAKKVYLIVRGEIKASKILVDRLKDKENVIVIKPAIVKKIIYDEVIKGVLLDNGTEIQLDGIFLAIGGRPMLSFVSSLDLEMDNGYLIVNNKMESSVKGIYGAGDIIKKDYYQIVTATNDGAIAALTISGKEWL